MGDFDHYDDEDLLAEYEQTLAPAAEPLHPTGEPEAADTPYLDRLRREIARRGLEEECRRRGLGPPA